MHLHHDNILQVLKNLWEINPRILGICVAGPYIPWKNLCEDINIQSCLLEPFLFLFAPPACIRSLDMNMGRHISNLDMSSRNTTPALPLLWQADLKRRQCSHCGRHCGLTAVAISGSHEVTIAPFASIAVVETTMQLRGTFIIVIARYQHRA